MEHQFSDEELIAIPARMLNARDRRRRRIAKRKLAELKGKERKARPAKNPCRGYNKAGQPCGCAALKGMKHCRAHLNEAERAQLGNPKTWSELGVEGKRLKPRIQNATVPSLMKSVVEVATERLIARYLGALGLEFIGFDEDGNPIVLENGMEKGVRIYGESKDGDIVMTDYPDLMAQIQVMEKLMDRTYGKPKQTNVIEGGSKPIKVQPVRSAERSQEVASLLQRVGAISPGVVDSTAEVIEVEASEPVESNVVPLKPERDKVE